MPPVFSLPIFPSSSQLHHTLDSPPLSHSDAAALANLNPVKPFTFSAPKKLRVANESPIVWLRSLLSGDMHDNLRMENKHCLTNLMLYYFHSPTLQKNLVILSSSFKSMLHIHTTLRSDSSLLLSLRKYKPSDRNSLNVPPPVYLSLHVLSYSKANTINPISTHPKIPFIQLTSSTRVPLSTGSLSLTCIHIPSSPSK